MTDILLSIKKKYFLRMLNGTKKYEFRKRIPKKRPIARVLLYITDPVQKIGGFFTYHRILRGTPEALWAHCQEEAGISKEAFFTYFKGYSEGYAYHIKRFIMFEEFQPPESFVENFHAPQNFIYLSEAPLIYERKLGMEGF